MCGRRAMRKKTEKLRQAATRLISFQPSPHPAPAASIVEEPRAPFIFAPDNCKAGYLMEVAVDDIVHVPEWAAPPSPRARQAWRAIVLSVAYVAIYVTLDRISFIEPLHGINITPWNPSTGVMLALLIIKGVRWSPLVLVAELISDATLSQIPVLPAPLFVAAIVVTRGYAGAAAILRHVRFEASLRRISDVGVLFLVASISSCLVASGFVA